MDFSIITYGGGEQLHAIFTAIAMLFSEHGSIMNIMALTLSISGVWLVFKAMKENSLISLFMWFIIFFSVSEIFIVPKVRVNIIDRAGGNHMYSTSNIPFGLALLASTTSSIGAFLTSKMEQAFSLPDDLKYQKSGLVFSSQMIGKSKELTIKDDNFKQNFNSFIQQCVCQELLMDRKYNIDDLLNSNDVWNLVSSNASPVIRFTYRAPHSFGENITCIEGVKRFNSVFDKVMKESIIAYGRRFFGYSAKSGNQYDELVKYQIMTVLPESFNYLMGTNNQTAESIIKQQLMISSISEGIRDTAGLANNYKIIRTKSMQYANQESAGLLAVYMLPVMRSVLEAIAYTLFIFVVILGVLPGGVKIVITYAKFLISLQLWAPLYAVLNLLITFYARQKTQGYLDGQGLTSITFYAISDINQDIASYAGYLSLMIPMIAWGLTQGGMEAFNSFISGALSNLQSNIAKATDEATSGNLSFDNKSIGNNSNYNTNSFKYNDNFSFDSGRFSVRHTSGAMLTTNPNGRSIIESGVGSTASNLLQNVNLQGSIMSSMAQSADHYETLALNEMSSASSQEAQAMNSAIEFAEHLANSEASGKSWSESDSAGVGKALSKILDSSNAFNENNQFDKGRGARILAAASIASDANAFGRILSCFGISARMDGSAESNASWKDLYQQSKSYLEKSTFQENMDHALRVVQDDSFRINDDQGQRFASNIRSSIDKAHSYREEASANLQKAESYRKAHSLTQSAGSSYGTNMNQAFYEWLQKEVGYEKANNMLSSSGYEVMPYAAKFAEQVSEGIVAEANQNFTNSQTNISNYAQAAAGLKNQYSAHDNSFINNTMEKIMVNKKGMRTVANNTQQQVESNIVRSGASLSDNKSQAQDEHQKFANHIIEKEKASVLLEAAKIPIEETIVRPLKEIIKNRSN